MSDIETASEPTEPEEIEPEEYVDSDDEMTESTVEVSADMMRILGSTLADTHGPVTAQSRTIHLRDRNLVRHSGVAVCRLTDPVLTVTRMTTPGTGALPAHNVPVRRDHAGIQRPSGHHAKDGVLEPRRRDHLPVGIRPSTAEPALR
jgi:hypothetical protein